MNALQSLEYGKVVLIHLNFLNKIFVYCSYSTYDTTLIGLIQDGNESACRQEVKELAVWCSHNNQELNTLKNVEMIVDFKRTPPHCSSPTHYHEQHCGCSGVIQVPGKHHLSGPEVGHSHWLHCEKGSAEVVLPSSTEKVQPTTGACDSFTLLLLSLFCAPL